MFECCKDTVIATYPKLKPECKII